MLDTANFSTYNTNMSKHTINVSDLKTFATLVAELVKQGLTFEAREESDGWVIELTGGY